MPTTKPRLSVTLEPGIYELISDIASVRGVSRSSVVSEYLDAAEPVLERTAAILLGLEARMRAGEENIHSDMEKYRHQLEQAERTLAPMLASALGSMDTLEPPPSNTGVTPPSSADDSEGSSGSKAPCGAAPSKEYPHDV